MAHKIKHKFTINDKVFFLDNNKVESGEVQEVFIRFDEYTTKITLLVSITSMKSKPNIRIYESDLFSSKKELLNSL